MRFDVGLWDRLFGERVTLEVPTSDGGIVKRRVTRRWVEAAKARGQLEEVDPAREVREAARLIGGADAGGDPGEALVGAAKFQATMLVPVFKTYPIMQTFARRNQWDFFVVVASVGVAHTALASVADSRRREHLQRSVETALSRFAPDGCACMLDFQRFVARTTSGDEVSHRDAVGAWVVWNLASHDPPSHEEMAPARTIGGMVEQVFGPWWSTQASQIES